MYLTHSWRRTRESEVRKFGKAKPGGTCSFFFLRKIILQVNTSHFQPNNLDNIIVLNKQDDTFVKSQDHFRSSCRNVDIFG